MFNDNKENKKKKLQIKCCNACGSIKKGGHRKGKEIWVWMKEEKRQTNAKE